MDQARIRLDLRFFIGAPIVNMPCPVVGVKSGPFPMGQVFRGVKPVASFRFQVKLEPELNREIGTLANTTAASMNYYWLGTWLGEVLGQAQILVDDPASLEGPALQDVVQTLQLEAEVHQQCPVDTMVLFVMVWRWDCESGGELVVIGDLRSFASLWIFGSGVKSIGTLFEVSSLFHSLHSPPSPALTVFPLSFLPSSPLCSIPWDFPL